jgi:hypothetical protein
VLPQQPPNQLEFTWPAHLERPISVFVSVQELGLMAANRISPPEFMQELLARLKEAGGPVEGNIIPFLRLAHGQLTKRKASGGPWFEYVWLPEHCVAGINAIGGLNGRTLQESLVRDDVIKHFAGEGPRTTETEN